MSEFQIVDELCQICSALANIVAVQRNVLEQHNAFVAEEEIQNVRDRYNALVGAGKIPGLSDGGDQL